MKYCSKCGVQLVDDAVVCVGCGRAVESAAGDANTMIEHKESGLTIAAKVFMIISTVAMGFFIIPLAWCIPMTVHYFGKVKKGEAVSVGFKICSLLFVSTIGGILMLCDKEH